MKKKLLKSRHTCVNIDFIQQHLGVFGEVYYGPDLMFTQPVALYPWLSLSGPQGSVPTGPKSAGFFYGPRA